MPQTPTRHPADSWPPTQLRLDPTAIEDASALTYFLTPSHDHDLTAGIETTPKEAALSTASLLLTRQYDERRGSPPLFSEPSSESDDEDYVRFPPGGLEVRRCPDETRRKADKGKRSFSRNVSSPSNQSRGRASSRKDEARRTWREPSPYVWSIDKKEDDAGRGGTRRRAWVGGEGLL